MGTTIEDIQYDEMLSEIHFEAVMKNEAKKQCIYLFVEGHSEEAAFVSLLEDCGIDFETDGIIIANYNGAGNLGHAIRLLRNTLSHDRPIIATYDDDLEGKKLDGTINDPLITTFKIPSSPVVIYKDNSKGGSFQESFTPDCFVTSCFKPKAIDQKVLEKETDFRKIFDPSKPWISQLAQFISKHGGNPGSINKVVIAENMASEVDVVPDTYVELARVITSIRAKNPIKHPDEVELKI